MLQRKRTRLLGFDYAQPGAYFVTTVAQDRRCVFGEVKTGVIRLFGYGEILVDRWHWLHQQYSYLTPDAFIVMPNHFHAIININTGPGRAGRDRPSYRLLRVVVVPNSDPKAPRIISRPT
jgi:hypothetical protein